EPAPWLSQGWSAFAPHQHLRRQLARKGCSLHGVRTGTLPSNARTHSRMQTYKWATLGTHRGSPRLWIDGPFAERAGFQAGAKFEAIENSDHVVLRLCSRGSRQVSSKLVAGGKRAIPVIDVNSRKVLDIFPTGCALRLIIRPGEILVTAIASVRRRVERTARLRRKFECGEALAIGSLTSGGGVLDHAVKTGLASAGITTRLAWANEIREDLM